MKNDCPKRKERDKKQENDDYTNFFGKGIVSVDVLVVNTTKHSDYMQVHKTPGRWKELEALVRGWKDIQVFH